MAYTRRFVEDHKVLATLYPASYASEQNTAWIDAEGYHRFFVDVIAGNIGTSLDVDIEVATDSSGSNLATLKSITQLTQAGSDDDSRVGIELRGEEFNVAGVHYKFFRVELTPNGATLMNATVWGCIPRYQPVGVTEWDEIVD